MKRVGAALAIIALLAGTPSPAAAQQCATDIADVIALEDAGRTYAPAELPRPFPEFGATLVPGEGAEDSLQVLSVAQSPADLTVDITPERTDVADPTQDLQVAVSWGGSVVVEAGYRDLAEEAIDLGELPPGQSRELAFEVELPAYSPLDNQTQERTWPFDVRIGAALDDEACNPPAPTPGSPGSEEPDDPTEAAPPGDAPPGELPFTGFGGWMMLLAAVLLLALGTGLTRLARRRRR